MLRPLTPDDAPAVLEVMHVAFSDLSVRFGQPPDPPIAEPERAYPRIRHLARTDPGGAWVAEADGHVVGAALALIREGLWGLSLLVVLPGHQSSGIGRELLARAVAYGHGARGGIILASEDLRALRSYSRAGFDVRPALDAAGVVRRRPERPAAVRRARWPDDEPIVDAASRHVRGATHSRDVPVLLECGRELLVHDGGNAFLARKDGEVVSIAAESEELAVDLLRAHLSDHGDGRTEAKVTFITAGQDWAVRTLLDAGLHLRPGGAIFVRGDVGPMTPYIPSGAYV